MRGSEPISASVLPSQQELMQQFKALRRKHRAEYAHAGGIAPRAVRAFLNDAVNHLLTVAFVACPVPHGDTVMLMLKLMIECARTGHLVETGIETDWRSFQSLADFQAKTFCPHCNRHHVWSKGKVSVQPAYPFMFIRTSTQQKALAAE
jgi:hypothetical protein